jgi:flagellar hook assembly protein FlgD
VLPETVDISITHVNGQVIAQFTKDSFPELHSGKNILTWNGMDINGNPLPNGIYIYKQIITMNEQQTAQHGKIVLLR